ncbi:multidrug resistance efflux transporter family protein [Seleniivibrio woodruffii]|uniref:DMT family transporter n=1 Tax=Seleniivibrio woodruffii TaxID=1078050 RepID=UPI0039E5C559
MNKALFYGTAGVFFFAFTFILNRSMHLSGGHWIWSASLRYFFTLPMLAVIVGRQYGFSNIHSEIKNNTFQWFTWSMTGFGLFYTLLVFAGDHGEAWLLAALWQVTIVMGVLMAPLFGSKISMRNLAASFVILAGVFLLQFQGVSGFDPENSLLTLIPILIAAIAYPLGNRKMMAACGSNISTIERIYGMTLCTMPLWILMAAYGAFKLGAPSANQVFQSFLVALFSGVVATFLYFKATDLAKTDIKQLALVESAQSLEVVFALIAGIIFLGDALPNHAGAAGIVLIIAGMTLNSLLALRH